MSRDPKADPKFGDVFVWRDGVIEFDVLYLKPQGDEGEFMGIELDPSALAAHLPNLFADIHETEWSFVENVTEGYATGGRLTGSWAADAWLKEYNWDAATSAFVKIVGTGS